ncbi:biotin operon repressor [Methylobacterium sp. BE186]|uniref:hypothetical protein n=1 Tax=Methylobacterium sp. BE186 TaxID=2817715 RepID=UPI002866F4DA|nr:hypothetical protein [Methylobacterium sp. BE186]MDR7037785.1 biotin operon repressor [Methylobacterium sp. BE186]
MIYFDTADRDGSTDAEAFRNNAEECEALPLPQAAQHTLDQLAEALGVTSALLRQNPSAVKVQGYDVSLVEATELLQAFIQIDDPEARHRCLNIVKEIAASQTH